PGPGRDVAPAGARRARRLRPGRRCEAARGRALRRRAGDRERPDAAPRRGRVRRRPAPRSLAPVAGLTTIGPVSEQRLPRIALSHEVQLESAVSAIFLERALERGLTELRLDGWPV